MIYKAPMSMKNRAR